MNRYHQALRTLHHYANETRSLGGQQSVAEAKKELESLVNLTVPKKPLEEIGKLRKCGYCHNDLIAVLLCCGNCGKYIDWSKDDE